MAEAERVVEERVAGAMAVAGGDGRRARALRARPSLARSKQRRVEMRSS